MIARSVPFRSFAAKARTILPAAKVRGVDPLGETELERELAGLPGWERRDGALRRRFEFPDFATALALANRVGEKAEEVNHHPDLLVTWGAVEVAWVNHAAGGITEVDVRMARATDELA